VPPKNDIPKNDILDAEGLLKIISKRRYWKYSRSIFRLNERSLSP